MWLGNQSCTAGWKFLDGSCYFFSNQTATWLKARKRCKEHGADLVTVTSDAENAFIVSHYSSLRCLSEGAWLGLRRHPKNVTRWIWLDELETELKYTKWHRKEPMNNRIDRNCTEIHPTKSIYWYGSPCHVQGCYICVRGEQRLETVSQLHSGVLPIMANTGRPRPKGVLFSGFRYIKG